MMRAEVFAVSIGRNALQAVFFSSLFFASSSTASEIEVEVAPPAFLAGPDGQMRILIALPLFGRCDVPWCDDPECTGGCAAEWPLLTDYTLEIELDGELASRRIELAAYPVTSYWEPDSLTWEFPWNTPGGDLFLRSKSQDKEVVANGRRKKSLKFSVLDAVREASREGLAVYGFALTAPIPPEVRKSEEGLLPQEVGALGKLRSIRFRIALDDAFGRAPRAFFFSSLFFGSSAPAYETEPDADSPAFIAGPHGQTRFLVPVPLSGACDVPWCVDPECERNCALDWPLLSDYVIYLDFDGEESSRQIELAAYPVTTFWDLEFVSWDFPWETRGGDLFLPLQWRDEGIPFFATRKKEWARFPVLDAVREASQAGHFIYGFALTPPILHGTEGSDTGLLQQEVAAIGKLEAVHFRLGFDLRVDPEQPPIEVIEVIGVVHSPPPHPLSDVKDKGYSIPTGKPSEPVIKPPTPKPPRTPTKEKKTPDPPPMDKVDEKEDTDSPPNDGHDLPEEKPVGD